MSEQTQTAPDSAEAFIARLRAIGAAAYHDKHPFNALMHQGKLTRRQLQAWIENRFYYQWSIPKKDATILAKADDRDFRREWIRRITDHDGTGESEGGISKWYRLAEAAGLDAADVASLRYVLPGVRFTVDAYVHLCATRSLTEAVASSLTELFAPVLMADRIIALEKLYPWLDARGLDYFRGRLVLAPRDSEYGLEYVVEHCTTRESQDRAADALTIKCHILWGMLDAIYYAYVSPGFLPPLWSDTRKL
ncbi:MAG TPA: pyrroloquinoline-quinone synthase PqqC, partial [Candidatus Binataceae bacterium]|nr:pyrroloquinoline-quinone synthase PqqC [Candidatus Binataceae bacterium]